MHKRIFINFDMDFHLFEIHEISLFENKNLSKIISYTVSKTVIMGSDLLRALYEESSTVHTFVYSYPFMLAKVPVYKE